MDMITTGYTGLFIRHAVCFSRALKSCLENAGSTVEEEGMLPKLRLADGRVYYVDLERGELRPVDDPTEYVKIKDVAPLLDTWDGNRVGSEEIDSEEK